MEDILVRAQAKVIKNSADDPMQTVVEIEAAEFYEMLNEIIRLRAVLEGINEMPPHFLSIKRLQKMARDGILPNE